MKNYSAKFVPIEKGDKFSIKQCPQNELECKQMKMIPYACAIESLMYAQTCTRSDYRLTFKNFDYLEVIGVTPSNSAHANRGHMIGR